MVHWLYFWEDFYKRTLCNFAASSTELIFLVQLQLLDHEQKASEKNGQKCYSYSAASSHGWMYNIYGA
ncbi:hypothetical protein AVDCRST_MAG94-5608 [uncultured Leptolyngbya sp.]|uniref:Uncharacterized protein n=1 Tax=uncultured Leptolyngbya sp. TaxID=332963 RepID=A0A6J4NR57_9CYAN|nr:hypothetical protein AVDCRST_MAG94-5608 [uncultured Leptolyngbya sp.]